MFVYPAPAYSSQPLEAPDSIRTRAARYLAHERGQETTGDSTIPDIYTPRGADRAQLLPGVRLDILA